LWGWSSDPIECSNRHYMIPCLRFSHSLLSFSDICAGLLIRAWKIQYHASTTQLSLPFCDRSYWCNQPYYNLWTWQILSAYKLSDHCSMASTSHSRSLLERISSDPSDPWAYDHCAAEETFQPRSRRPKRKQEPEIDSEYLYTPWIDGMKVKGDESKNQR